MHLPQAFAQLANHTAGLITSLAYRHHHRRHRYSAHQADFDTMLTKARADHLPGQAELREQRQRTRPQVGASS